MQQHAVTSVRCVAAWLFLLAMSLTFVLCTLARDAPALQRRKSFILPQARILVDKSVLVVALQRVLNLHCATEGIVRNVQRSRRAKLGSPAISSFAKNV